MSDTEIIQFHQVSKFYQQRPVVQDLNLTVKMGELFVLVGPSGSGKTTTLKMINRLVEPSQGNIRVAGKDNQLQALTQLRQSIGYVLQEIALFPNMTIGENVMLPLQAAHRDNATSRQQAERLLNQVGLSASEYFDRKPADLSGGEQQRVGIIRGLIARPQIVLMDEPFSALDPLSRRQLQDLVLTLHQEYKMTIVFVTHDMTEAVRLGQRIGIMQNGHLLQVGSPSDLLMQPANEFVRDFMAQAQVPAVKAMVMAGFGQAVGADQVGHQPQLPISASLATLASKLQQQTQVVVEGNRVLTQADVMAFLASQEEDRHVD
ncbi:ABC transporter ATP-binding protein [Weissella halotolerans]|uniref:ABC-type quaternary amine transporter n=1 Tax=Weissella halotolerans DSM 20190 TaxID=1123500 RepID=A0A0R2G566_9LACO|nr:ABC transporter ATP-binding protein [Weissella halotolerans]KRN32378.1 ABC-type proline glycine betaine transport system, ATPase component [Weissella halotolerans DSM 20190]